MAYSKYVSATAQADPGDSTVAITVDHDAVWHGGNAAGNNLVCTLKEDTVAVTFGNVGKGCFLPIQLASVYTSIDLVLLESGERWSN